MRRHIFTGSFALLVCVAVEAAPTIDSLQVEPKTIQLNGAGATQRILALARSSDGLERDVTAEASFSVKNPQVARIEDAGRVAGVADGATVVQVSLGERKVSVPVEVRDSRSERPETFERNILPILTKRGCNGAECHGGVKGRGGLKLSLNALAPREDHQWILKGGGYQVLTTAVKEPVQPRIDLKNPEKSLLLLKPAMAVPHGGGRRFKEGSPDYQTIVSWIRLGAPYSDKEHSDAAIARLEVFPDLVVLDAQGKSRILVTAHLADGPRRDVSEQVRYESANRGVFSVSEDGTVQATGLGEASLLVHGVGSFGHAQIAVIREPAKVGIKLRERNFIDREIFAKLRRLSIQPSELSSDSEFLRRVCLDLTGTLPPPERAREFLAGKDPGKRDKLIEVLIDSPEFIEFWTFRFSDLFRVGTGIPRGSPELWEWIRSSIATNKPYDKVAAERIASEGSDGPSRRYIEFSKVQPIERNMAELMRVFLGRRLDCAQCHNHPTETWTQQQFWGLTAFFGRITMTDWVMNQVVYDDPDGQERDQVAGDDKALRFNKVANPRTKDIVVPAYPDGRLLAPERQADPRRALAEWMTKNPWFAEAAVNRVWSHYFGRGIVDPVDDFRATNPPTHPSLLQALADDFRKHGHDLRYLMRQIVQSTAYQLSSLPNASNGHDVVNYSHRQTRALDAEVLLDAISSVTGVPEVFSSQPEGTRAIQLLKPSGASHFLDVYGTPQRSAVDDRDNRSNLRQALHMLVGETYTTKLSRPGGRLEKLLKAGRSPREIIEEFYLAGLTRYPTPREMEGLEQGIASSQGSREAYEDMVWALVGAREFVDNH